MQKKENKIKLTISILVSNSITTIEKCMQSIVPILQSIPSELIIVDTGGIDGSIEIAKKYANVVIPFTWCNDFAKARNTGLERARGEWFLFLDDDEWFENTDEIIDFFRSDEYLKYESASYEIRNYKNREGTEWNSTRYYRMIKLRENTRFVSPIHEILEPVYAPEKEFECYVHHYGYVFETKEEKIRHSERNIVVLEEILRNNPKDIRLWMQLSQEYVVMGKLEESCKISEKAVREIESLKHKLDEEILVVGWHIKNLLHIKIELGYLDEVYDKAKQYLGYDWLNLVTKNNILHVLSNVSFLLKKYESCCKYAIEYFQTYKKISGKQETKIGKYLSDQYKSYSNENRFKTGIIGLKSADYCYNKEKELILLKELTKQKFLAINKEDLNKLLTSIVEIKDEETYRIIMESFLKKELFRKMLVGLIEDDVYKLSRNILIKKIAI